MALISTWTRAILNNGDGHRSYREGARGFANVPDPTTKDVGPANVCGAGVKLSLQTKTTPVVVPAV